MSIEQRIILLQEPNSLVAESYRSLRAALSRSLAKGKRRFIIVSAWGGEGKSMVSANLAVAFSQLLMDVVLIDGDLRRPTISRVFEQDTKPGLMELLENGGDTLERLYPTSIERLSILPAGNSKSNPGDLLGKGTFEAVMRDLATTDKCVVMDTSPMSACSDALLMGVHADGAVMVVSPDKWQGEAEAHFVQDLEDHGIEVLGAVLNKADPSEKVPGSSSSSYGYGYGYGHSYGYGQGYGREHTAPNKEKGRLATLFSRKNRSKDKES